MKALTEYRCTRSKLYTHDCIGRDDVGARQGHYVVACSRECAQRVMEADFPSDSGRFTVDVSKSVSWPAKCECCAVATTGKVSA
ncbi:MAG: hypothetical protein JRD89_03475 [Deltaproteobacteria bacterium]|nr:hypothetical protein [Deltaproteobacteria bacterium]